MACLPDSLISILQQIKQCDECARAEDLPNSVCLFPNNCQASCSMSTYNSITVLHRASLIMAHQTQLNQLLLSASVARMQPQHNLAKNHTCNKAASADVMPHAMHSSNENLQLSSSSAASNAFWRISNSADFSCPIYTLCKLVSACMSALRPSSQPSWLLSWYAYQLGRCLCPVSSSNCYWRLNRRRCFGSESVHVLKVAGDEYLAGVTHLGSTVLEATADTVCAGTMSACESELLLQSRTESVSNQPLLFARQLRMISGLAAQCVAKSHSITQSIAQVTGLQAVTHILRCGYHQVVVLALQRTCLKRVTSTPRGRAEINKDLCVDVRVFDHSQSGQRI